MIAELPEPTAALDSGDHRERNSCRQALARDVLGLCVLLAIAATVGFTANHFRKTPLPLVYQSKAARLEHQVQAIADNSQPQNQPAPAASTNATVSIISLEQFRHYVDGKDALILDARPDLLFGMGHVPRALNLPRDGFEAAYARLKGQLENARTRPLVVYCSDSDCDDSDLVAKALLKLGYPQVFRFKDGWAAWQAAHLPEEKTP